MTATASAAPDPDDGLVDPLDAARQLGVSFSTFAAIVRDDPRLPARDGSRFAPADLARVFGARWSA